MCSTSVMEWVCFQALKHKKEMQNSRILEVGSKNVNGSVKRIIEAAWNPREYVGVDIEYGKNVDMVLDVKEITDRFGFEAFDAVICMEVMEHVKEWRPAVINLKMVLKTNGILLLTTRSFGFPYHGYPHDYWRYEVSDMENIFADMTNEIEQDSLDKGVFVFARRPPSLEQQNYDLAPINLYSIANGHRVLGYPEMLNSRKLFMLLRKLKLISASLI